MVGLVVGPNVAQMAQYGPRAGGVGSNSLKQAVEIKVEEKDASDNGSLVRQTQRSWLKDTAPLNISLRFPILPTCHPDTSELKLVASLNIQKALMTLVTTQIDADRVM